MQGTRLKGGRTGAIRGNAGAIVQILVALLWLAADTAVAQIAIAINDSFTLAEDSGNHDLDVLANDIVFGDNDDVEIIAVGAPSGGVVSIEGGGERLRYRPNDDFFGTDQFTYTVEGNGQATVTVTVTPVNDEPEAVNDTFAVAEDSADSPLDVLANDSDIDGDALALTAVTPPNQGGTVTITEDGTGLLYSPAPNFSGEEKFGYTMTDGTAEDTADVTVTVTAVNDAPVAAADTYTVAEDSSGNTLDVLANDADPDGAHGDLRITAVGDPANGSASIVDDGRRIEYSPGADFAGDDAFTYTVTDADGATATANAAITVDASNDDPAATDDTFTVDENTSANALDVLGNDTDAEGSALTISAVTSPDQGGTVTIAEGGGSLVYSPAPGFDGEERFSYVVEDADGGSDNADVLVTVTNVNSGPTATADSFTVTEDSGATELDVLANDDDPDAGDTLTIASVSTPSGGTATITAGATRIAYQPRANFAGADSFTYTVRDSTGATDSATVTLTVTPVNDAPTAADDTFAVDEDSGSNRLDVLANDDDPDGGTLRVTAVAATSQGGTVTIDNGGAAVSYQPAPEFSGIETFTYTLADDGGVTASATVTVDVASRNDAPVVAPDPIPDQTAEEAQPFVLDLREFVSDADSDVASLVFAQAAGSSPLPAGLTLSGAGLLSGTPHLGTSVGEHTLRFTVSDGASTTTSEPFNLTVLRAGRVDLSVEISAAPNPARPSETVTWTFSVANAAPDTPATSVRLDVGVTGNVPFSFDDAAAQGCAVTPAGNGADIACTIAEPIAGASSRDVTLTGRGSQAGEIVAAATVSIAAASPLDEINSNDTASLTLSIAEAISGSAAQRIEDVDARAAAAGDLDGDGHDDLVVATGPAHATLVYLNVVDPTNEHKRMLSTAPLALGQAGSDNDVAVVDFDNDGDLDIVTAAGGGRSNMVFTNDGAGAFTGTALPGPAGGLSVAAGDFDGDGNVDLVFAKLGADIAHRGTGSGTAFLAGIAFGSGDSRDVEIVNLFGNDVPEVVVANADGDAQIYRGTGGSLTLDRTLPTGPTTSVTSGDFDGDGFADLVFGKEPTGGSPLAANLVFMNAAAAGGGLTMADALGAAPTVGIASADADLDGDTDVVFVNRTGAHQLFINTDAPGGGFELHPQQVAMPRALSAVAAPLGSDDRVDLALVGSDGIAVYYNDGDGNFGLGDTQAPTLRLNGVPDVTLRVGSSYSDAGAIATDAQDGDVSSRIEVTNPVNTAIIGTYEVVYEVTDESGNRAVPLARTVRVAPADAQAASGGGGGGAVDPLLALALALALAAVKSFGRRPASARSARAGTPC